jgi:hypothetical protein
MRTMAPRILHILCLDSFTGKDNTTNTRITHFILVARKGSLDCKILWLVTITLLFPKYAKKYFYRDYTSSFSLFARKQMMTIVLVSFLLHFTSFSLIPLVKLGHRPRVKPSLFNEGFKTYSSFLILDIYYNMNRC